MAKPPVAFLLASQAALCAPGLVGYGQLLEEIQLGRLSIDASTCHEGKWLLDHAIEARQKSSAGMREFRKNRGADPAMDAIWRAWLDGATPELLGSVSCRADRSARLAQLGCVHALDASLMGLSATAVQRAWDGLHVAALRSALLAWVAKEDLRGTAGVLLRHGFAGLPYDKRSHPLLEVKSAVVMDLLLGAGMDPISVGGKEGTVIDYVSTRPLPAAEMARIIEVVRSRRMVEDTVEHRVARIAVGLQSKTLEQLRLEMRAANWSPARRNGAPSPVVKFARAMIDKMHAPSQGCGAGLAWLAQQAQAGIVQEGERWSEAAWLWAASYAFSPSDSERFASRATDLPGQVPARRLETLQAFLASEHLPANYLEFAIAKTLQYSRWDSKDGRDLASLMDVWFQNEDDPWVLRAYRCRLDRSPCLQEVGEHLQKHGSPCHWPGWMSLALVVAHVQDDERLMDFAHARWQEGVRPMATLPARRAVISCMQTAVSELASAVRAWDLDLAAAPPASPKPRPRF